MVEDASGKGFYLNKGTRIGRSVVSRIEEGEVRLTEMYRTRQDYNKGNKNAFEKRGR